MKKLFLILALLFPSTAWAQCTGVFPPGTFCGNTGASPAPPAASPIMSSSSTFIGGSNSASGPPYALNVALPNANLPGGLPNPLLALFSGGNSSTPPTVTFVAPLVSIIKQEQIGTPTISSGQNAALLIQTNSNNTSSSGHNTGSFGIKTTSFQFGQGEAVGITSSAFQEGPGGGGLFGYEAIGGFFQATGTTATASNIALRIQTLNQTGSAQPYSNYTGMPNGLGTPLGFGIDIAGDSGGTHQLTAAVNIRNNWDVGISFAQSGGYGDPFTGNFYIHATNFAVATSGAVVAQSYFTGASAGVTCSGTPSSSFASAGGIVTHC